MQWLIKRSCSLQWLGTMAALAALLFVSRGRRTGSRSTTASSNNEPSSTSLAFSKNNQVDND
jgi:hypothetical protein